MTQDQEQADPIAVEPVGTTAAVQAGIADLCREASELKREIADAEEILDRKKKAMADISHRILGVMDLTELEQVRAHGFLFYREHKTSVSAPKEPEKKKELFDFLEARGILLDIASVNSQTLNSLFKALANEAAEAGDLDYRMPGVGEPVNYVNLKMRRS